MNTTHRNGDEPAIEAHGLVKAFGRTRAVEGLDLTVPAGTVYGVLGPNGAGKTTTIRILATLLRPDAGTARVLGHDVVRDAAEVRARVSLTGQFAALDGDLTGRENLEMIGRLLGISRARARARADELLHALRLDDAADRRVKDYSGGMRRRVDLAASLILTPDLLFLDEPTTGLDPRSRNDIWALVRAIVAAGTTVLLTTQYLEEADRLADRIALVDGGRVIAEGTPATLKASVGAGSVEVRVADPEDRAAATALLERTLGVAAGAGADPAAVSAAVPDLHRVPALLEELRWAGIELAALTVGQPRLDEVFLALTGHSAHDTTSQEELA